MLASLTGIFNDFYRLGFGRHATDYIPAKNIPSSKIVLGSGMYLRVIPSALKATTTMELREQKGLEPAAKSKFTWQGDRWFVPSQSHGGTNHGGQYIVKPDAVIPNCTCPDYELRGMKCKHIYAVEFTIRRECTNDCETQTVTETVTVKKTYSQEWPAYNKAQTEEKDHFQSLVHELCQGVGEPSQKMGRPRLPFEGMIFSATFKAYSTVSGRRFMSDLRDAHKKGYISKLPCYNSIFNYFENEALTPYLKMLIEESSLPLTAIESDFAADSSGFSTCRFYQWVDAKYKNPKLVHKRAWVKVHLMCGVKTNVVTAVEMTDRYAADCPYHKRSNVETTFSMIKAKFGDSLRSKTETAQINEALCMVLCHNLCCLIQSMFELNVKPEFWATEARAI